jgi:predicted nucleotidyltransferase component of viral defense system/predicted transcriptional regulator of viral defense system
MANNRALKPLDRFVSERRTAFSAAEVRDALGTSPQATSNLLARLASLGLVDRLAVGRFAVRQIGALCTAAVWNDLGSAVAAVFAGRPHRIGFLTALDHHGLLVRPVRSIQVASPYRPREKALTGRTLRVIRESEETVLVGTEPLGPSRIATIPRALLDAASRPLLVGGASRVAEALEAADNIGGLRDPASEVNAEPAYRRIGSMATTLSLPVGRGLEPPLWRSLTELDRNARGGWMGRQEVGRRLAVCGVRARGRGGRMIAKGLITQRANDEGLPAQTIERDYVLAHICADIGTAGDTKLVFKGGTLLRLCYFADYRYSADLDFSAVNGLSSADATTLVAAATDTCRKRLELPVLEVVQEEGGAPWVNYVGPFGAKARKIKLDISDTELVESHTQINLQPRWPDLPEGTAIDGYTLDEVAAEKVRCIAERLQCRDLYDMHQLLDGGHVDPLEAWHLYLRKTENDRGRGRQRTSPREWSATFERRMVAYRNRWDEELGD